LVFGLLITKIYLVIVRLREAALGIKALFELFLVERSGAKKASAESPPEGTPKKI
jgi:hypothetical protein